MAKLTFKYKLKLVKGMRPTTFRINSSYLQDEELAKSESATEPATYEGEITATTFLESVTVSVFGVGTPFLNGTFNVSLNGKNLFDKDQTLDVNKKGRFRFYKKETKLP